MKSFITMAQESGFSLNEASKNVEALHETNSVAWLHAQMMGREYNKFLDYVDEMLKKDPGNSATKELLAALKKADIPGKVDAVEKSIKLEGASKPKKRAPRKKVNESAELYTAGSLVESQKLTTVELKLMDANIGRKPGQKVVSVTGKEVDNSVVLRATDKVFVMAVMSGGGRWDITEMSKFGNSINGLALSKAEAAVLK